MNAPPENMRNIAFRADIGEKDTMFDRVGLNRRYGQALEQLRIRINYLPIGIALLPEKFTMKEFQTLYESILHKDLDRGNFQKKMLKLGILDRGEKKLSGKAHKAPYLYTFNKERYDELLQKGIGYMS